MLKNDSDEENGNNYYDTIDDEYFDAQYKEIRERMNEMYDTQREDIFNYIDTNNIDKNNTNNLTVNDSQPKTNADVNTINKKYKYRGLSVLMKKDLKNYIQDCGFTTGNIIICAYQVNTTGLLPFLQFIMTQNGRIQGLSNSNSNTTTYSMPKFKYSENQYILETCGMMLDMLLMYGTESKTPQYKYNGFIQEENNFYVFFDFSNYNIEHQHMILQNDLSLVLIDEIMNHKKVGNINIDKCIVDFFSVNHEFLQLADSNNNNYEIPAVVYSGNIGNMVDFTYIFGVSKSNTEWNYEPYYYFTDYNNAIEQSYVLKQNYNCDYPKTSYSISCGVIRFAVFLGNTEIYKNQANMNSSSDSIYINGDSSNNKPYWATQKYEQQTSLSTQFITSKY